MSHVYEVFLSCWFQLQIFLFFISCKKKPSEIWQIRHFRSCNRSKTSSFSLLCFLIRLFLPELLISNISKDEFVTSLFHNRKLVERKWCKTILIILWTTPCTFLFLTCLSLNSVILNVSFFIFKSQNFCVGLFSDWKITVKLNISPVLLTLA